MLEITPGSVMEWVRRDCHTPPVWTISKVADAFRGRTVATVAEVLDAGHISAFFRLWVLTRPGVLPDKDLRLFCATVAKDRIEAQPADTWPGPDPRSISAVASAMLYANGVIDDAQLHMAWERARDAARDAADIRRMGRKLAWDASTGGAWSAVAATERDPAWGAWLIVRGVIHDAAYRRLLAIMRGLLLPAVEQGVCEPVTEAHDS